MSENTNNLPKSAAIWAVVTTACLLGIGIGFDWTAAVVVVVVATLVWLGYQLAHEKLTADYLKVKRERAALDAEWEALDRTRRIRDTFWDARIAMREEAQRYWPTDGPNRGGQ
jgi:fatty acid desaturase